MSLTLMTHPIAIPRRRPWPCVAVDGVLVISSPFHHSLLLPIPVGYTMCKLFRSTAATHTGKTSSTLLYWGTQKGWSTRVIAEITFIAIEGGVWGKPSYHRNKNIEHNTEWNLFFSPCCCCCFSMFPKHFLKLCEAIGNHWKDICRYQNHLNLLNGGRGRGRGSRADTSIKRVVRTRTSKCGWNTNKLPEEIPPLKFYRVE